MMNDERGTMNEEIPVLCLVRDLLFFSKIRAAAESSGVIIKSLRDPAKLVNEIGCGLIVDLNQEGALLAAIEWRRRMVKPVAGFVSHVDSSIIKQAREAGIDQILVRSQFEKSLPGILSMLNTPSDVKMGKIAT